MRNDHSVLPGMPPDDGGFPEMKKRLMAVFGHYDSRGGTMAIPMSEVSEAEFARVSAIYNAQFAWGENGEDPTWQTPAETDILYIANLWYEDEPNWEEDLENQGVVLEPDDAWEAPEDFRFSDPGAVLANIVDLEFIKTPPVNHDEDRDDAAILASAKVVKATQIRNWNDDAYGFCVTEKGWA